MSKIIKKSVFSVLMICALANAAVIFEDDFTSHAVSRDKWMTNLSDTNMMTVKVDGGNCAINNKSIYTGLYRHAFTGTKPSVFTLSFVMRDAPAAINGKAGVLFCQSNDFDGYFITLYDNYLYVFEGQNTVFSTTLNFDGNPNGNNEITVSKNGAVFNIFLNGVFKGNFTNSKYDSGDVAFLVHAGTSVVLGPVSVTDQFTVGKERTSFADNFEGNNLKYWNQFADGATIKEEAGKLKITTPSGKAAPFMFVDFNLTNFEAGVEVSHRSGSASSVYGITLVGKTPPNNEGYFSYLTVSFVITGGRSWCIMRNTGSSVTLEKDNIIGGAVDQGVYFVDTLKVQKKSGSSTYEFSVNGKLLSSAYPVVDFDIIGIGLFCEDNLNLEFDNFYAVQEGATSITWKPNQRPAAGSKQFIQNSGHTFYDLRGRKRFTVGQQPLSRGAQTRAAGMYLNEQGREIRIKKTPLK